MDPVSAVASIVSLLEVTGATINLIRKLAASHRSARKEQEQAARRLFDLSSVLGQVLVFRKSFDGPTDGLVPSAGGPEYGKTSTEMAKEHDSLEHCMLEVTALKSLLEQMMRESKFVWVYKADKVQKRLEQIKIDVDTLQNIFQNTML